MASYKEFAAKLKEKYPAYKDSDDRELAQAFIKKYPAYKDRVTFDAETYGEEQYKNQNPGTRFLEGAGEFAEGMNKVNPMVPLGKAIGWGVDKLDKGLGYIPGYNLAKKPFDMAREGYEKYLPMASEEAFNTGHTALGYGLGALGIAGEMVTPRNPVDFALANAGKLKKTKTTTTQGQLPLPIKAADEMRPEIASTLRKAAPSPFDALDQIKSMEAKAHESANKLLDLSAQETHLERQNAAAKQVLGADLPFRGDLELGKAMRESVEATRKQAKAPLAAEQAVVEGAASEHFGQPTTTAKVVHDILTDDVNAGLINMSQDASLNRILKRITGLDKPVAKGKIGFDTSKMGESLDELHYKTDRRRIDPDRPEIPVEVTQLKDTNRLNVNLKELMRADSDLGKLIADETAKWGDKSPKGAILSKVKQAVREDIDRISAEVWKADPEMAGKIPALRQKWANYFKVFDNETIRKIRKADDPAVLFNSIKDSEQAMERLRTALGNDAPVYREFRTKYLNEIMIKLDKAENKAEFLDSVLQEPAGNQALTKFLTDGDRAELSGMAANKIRIQTIKEEFTKLETDLENMTNQTRGKRLGELDKIRGRRASDRAAEKVWDIASDKIKQHGIRYATSAFGGSVMFATGHPIVAGIAVIAGITPDILSAGYANHPKFRIAVNSMVDSPSAAKAIVLENAAREYMLSRKDEKPQTQP